ncbi:Uncharacterized protein DAT39_002382, partial [Clarias magur]
MSRDISNDSRREAVIRGLIFYLGEELPGSESTHKFHCCLCCQQNLEWPKPHLMIQSS